MASNESSPSPSPLMLSFPDLFREDVFTQECKELLPTLPSVEDFLFSVVYLYRGCWFWSYHLNGFLSCRSNFRSQDDDVILATLPKSGTTWLKAILFTLSCRARPSTGSQQPNPLLTTNPHDLVPFLEMGLFAKDENPDLSSFVSPRVFATHLPYALLPQSIRDSGCKVIYLCRNLKDVFVSLFHFRYNMGLKERGEKALEEEFDKFSRGVTLFGPCWDHVLGYWKASLEKPEKVLFLKYEDMKARPLEIIKKLAEFTGCPFDEDEEEAAHEVLRVCSFESLSKLEVNVNGKVQSGLDSKMFFRKGEVGDWTNLLTPEMADRLDRITDEKLSGSGLKL